MPLLNKYKVYIFDCDGVILDSNQLKIEAMKGALEVHCSGNNQIAECIEYFRKNFGKSRFHHVEHFVTSIMAVSKEKQSRLKSAILEDFSERCCHLYIQAELTPGFIHFVERCEGKKYVASGSEQKELRKVFMERKLDRYFDGVFGSPTPKTDIIEQIIKKEKSNNAVMIGDALSDLESAVSNDIDFIAYIPYSNVADLLRLKAGENGFLITDDWESI